jgi:hypothetical protein
LITAGTPLAQAISEGAESIQRLVESGELPELEEALQRLRDGIDDEEDDDANLELRPEEHESYDGGDDQRFYEVSSKRQNNFIFLLCIFTFYCFVIKVIGCRHWNNNSGVIVFLIY